jgi:hypothetical protein
LLPTPTARYYGNNRGGRGGREAGKPRHSLESMARHNLWPTPTVKGMHRRSEQSRKSGDGLAVAVAKQALWPTPMASDGTGGPWTRRPDDTKRGRTLKEVTPGPLNPTWVEWLMGFPPGWTDCEGSATLSSPRSPSGSEE